MELPDPLEWPVLVGVVAEEWLAVEETIEDEWLPVDTLDEEGMLLEEEAADVAWLLLLVTIGDDE